MHVTRQKTIILLALLLLVALGISAYYLYPRFQQRWSTPLGPSLGLPTQTAVPPTQSGVFASTATPVAEENMTREVEETQESSAVANATAPEPQSSPTPKPEPLCGGPETMTILAVGADSGPDYLYGLADVIRIVRVDFVTPKVSVLSLPRDLWVEIPEIENPYGITHGKLNQSFFYGSPGMGYYQGPGGAPGLLARTLDLNFGLRVDHYGAVDMSTFVEIVDAVGGLEIYLPYDVDGRPIDEKTEDMGYFNAGQQHFTGEEALRFSRIRKKYNDFTRMDHQNMVICALKEKITSPAVITRIPQMIAAFQDSVLTDLSPEQLTQLACLAPKLSGENLLFTGLPEEILSPGRVYSPQQKNQVFIMEADFEVIRDYVSQFMAGTWPQASTSNQPSCP
jgi:LCP family protein required for cell wall assembly